MLQTLAHGSNGEIVELRLDRPRANALTPELLAALASAVRETAESGAHAIVLSGREGMFSAGLDIPHFMTLDRSGVRDAWLAFFDMMEALASSPVPIVGALTGHAPAGGCVIALCCDWRILAEGPYRIGLNEVQVGVRIPVPILAATRHVVGRRQAERMCSTAELLDTEEALRIGLVDELAPVDQVVPRSIAWAEKMIALPRTTLRKSRALARREFVAAFDYMDEEQLELFLDEWFDDECQGALRALVERLEAKKSGTAQ